MEKIRGKLVELPDIASLFKMKVEAWGSPGYTSWEWASWGKLIHDRIKLFYPAEIVTFDKDDTLRFYDWDNDDRRINIMGSLLGKEVVITEKLDGENTSLHSHKLHARSDNESGYPWQSAVKAKGIC
jgi:hypothetical protein